MDAREAVQVRPHASQVAGVVHQDHTPPGRDTRKQQVVHVPHRLQAPLLDIAGAQPHSS